jgi:hypothetical protein
MLFTVKKAIVLFVVFNLNKNLRGVILNHSNKRTSDLKTYADLKR